MDNITHSLVGLSLARAGLDRKTELALPALLIGANLPDAEVITNLFGGNYLDTHRGLSHAPAGIAVLSLGLAGALRLYAGFRRRPGARVPAFFPLWYVSLAGMLTHPFLDYLNDYGIRPWLPFSTAKVYGDLLTLFDPWLWLILSCGLAVLARSVPGRICWAASGFLLLTAVVLGWSPLTALLWIATAPAALGLGLFLRNRGVNPARAALLLMVLYLGTVAGAREYVVRSARNEGPALVPGKVEQIDVIPGRPSSIGRWTVVLQTADKYYFAEVGMHDWRRSPPHFDVYAKNLDDPYYHASLADGRMAALARFARFPSVTVEPTPDGRAVVLRDLRYARLRSNGWGAVRVVVPGLRP